MPSGEGQQRRVKLLGHAPGGEQGTRILGREVGHRLDPQDLGPGGVRPPVQIRGLAPGQNHQHGARQARQETLAQPALQSLALFEGIHQEHRTGAGEDRPGLGLEERGVG
jgi:hypothetical protein